MEITVGKLADGKPTIIKGKEYLSTEEYTKPFVDLMGKFANEVYVQVQLPSQLTLTDSKEDITYNRVGVQSVMPSTHDIDGLAETYNLVYGLDIRQPVYKLFKAYKDRRNDNLFVFDSQWLNVYELKPSTEFIDFETTIRNQMQLTDDSEKRIQKMKETFFSSDVDDRQQKLGSLIERSMTYEYHTKGGKTKIAPAMVLKAYQSVYMDTTSKWYVPETEECSLFNYYEAFASLITTDDKDILSRFEKCAVCQQILHDEIGKG